MLILFNRNEKIGNQSKNFHGKYFFVWNCIDFLCNMCFWMNIFIGFSYYFRAYHACKLYIQWIASIPLASVKFKFVLRFYSASLNRRNFLITTKFDNRARPFSFLIPLMLTHITLCDFLRFITYTYFRSFRLAKIYTRIVIAEKFFISRKFSRFFYMRKDEKVHWTISFSTCLIKNYVVPRGFFVWR